MLYIIILLSYLHHVVMVILMFVCFSRTSLRFIRIDKYRSWYQALLPEREVGTMIAIRPSKKHFCEFIPNSCVQSSNHETGARRRHHRTNGSSLDAGFVGLNDSDDETRQENVDIFHGITHWLDKLQDGILPKISVADWPELKWGYSPKSCAIKQWEFVLCFFFYYWVKVI